MHTLPTIYTPEKRDFFGKRPSKAGIWLVTLYIHVIVRVTQNFASFRLCTELAVSSTSADVFQLYNNIIYTFS
jgi:hypothetical protein